MFGVTINIDPTSEYDLKKTIDFLLSQPCMSRYRENYMMRNTNNNQRENNSEITQLKNQVKNLNDEIQRHVDENIKNQKKITEQDKQISDLTQSVTDITEKYNDAVKQFEKDKKKVEDDCYKAMSEEDVKHKEALKQLQNQLEQKSKMVTHLEKQLENYSLSYGTDNPDEKSFFEVQENGILKQNMISSDSLYCASKSGEIFKFTINGDDGPIKAALSNIDFYLKPFCEITEHMEGANSIRVSKVGTASILGTQLRVKDKAVISLIKQ